MKKNIVGRYRLLLLTLFMFGFVSLTPFQAKAQDGAFLISDKDDYAPGEIATISGAGFFPGEAIDLSIAISDPESELHIGDYAWTEVASDDYGNFSVGYLVPPEAAGMNLLATAMGLESGFVATVAFTDSHYTLEASSITAVGTTVTVSLTIGGAAPKPNFVFANVIPGYTGFGLQLLKTSDPNTQTSIWSASFTGTCGTEYSLNNIKTAQALTGSAATRHESTLPLATPKKATVVCPPPPPTNRDPVITCLNLPAELGKIVGCLTDDGFGKTVDVVYDFVAPNVRATFFDGATILGTVNVATVTDPDGDIVTVDLDPEVSSVDLVGPGFTSETISINIIANDGKGGFDDDDDCDTTVNAQITYDFGGFRPPLTTIRATMVKKGSTIPVKFRLYDCDGNEICESLSVEGHVIKVVYNAGNCPTGDVTVNDSGSSNSNGVNFRYGGICGEDGNWIYNLSTKTGYAAGCTYKIIACLDDGTEQCVLISLK